MEKKIFALGFFDGVHLGHQALLRACSELAAELDVETAAITFESHPQSLFIKQTPPLLTALEDRCKLLLHYGVDHVYPYPVTEKVMSTDWRVFLEELMLYGGVGFVCGHDFRFGHKGEGDSEKLRAACAEAEIPCTVVPQQKLDGQVVSSTYIRGLLEEGKMAEAVRFLGHAYLLTGQVVSGKQLGRTIGVPTANLLLPAGILCPRFGVYACKAIVDRKEYLAVTNVGTRPTVEGDHVNIEAHLLDFDGDLYGKHMTLGFYEFLRPEQKFGSLEELQAEIQKNIAQTRKIFEKS